MNRVLGEIVRRSVNSSSFTLSFSSEAPVRRAWGIEILSHAPGAVHLDRLEQVGTLLVNHDWDDPVGRLDDVRIERRRGLALATLAKTARGREVQQLVDDEVLRAVSVSYAIRRTREGGRNDAGEPVFIVEEWEPLEVSVVSVPADYSVGVGRSAAGSQTAAPGHARLGRTEYSDVEAIRLRSALSYREAQKQPPIVLQRFGDKHSPLCSCPACGYSRSVQV